MCVRKRGDRLLGIKLPRFEYEFEASVRDELEGQLRSYEELREIQREENEPESKCKPSFEANLSTVRTCVDTFPSNHSVGALLTTALMMRAIDRPGHHATTLENLAKLRSVDPMRTGYYADLADKWRIEEILQQWIEGGATGDVDLGGSGVASLHYDQYLCVADVLRLDGGCQLRADGDRKLGDIYAACGVDVKRV